MFLTLICLVFFSGSALSHTLWINCFDSFSHKPGHAIVSIGYGHRLPLDDFLDSRNAQCRIISYELADPGMNRVALPLPKLSEEKGKPTGLGITVRSGDIGLQKLSFTDESPSGTFQVGAVSKADFFTLYENEKGRKKWAFKPMDQVKSGQVIQSCLYKAMAKTCFSKGEWRTLQPLGHDLEIIPMTDLSGIRAGEQAVFKVLFFKKSYSSTPSNIARITAHSNTFGGPDNYYLAANLIDGKAGIRIPAPGQWVVNVYVSQDVEKNKALSSLTGKCLQVHHTASLSFTVKP